MLTPGKAAWELSIVSLQLICRFKSGVQIYKVKKIVLRAREILQGKSKIIYILHTVIYGLLCLLLESVLSSHFSSPLPQALGTWWTPTRAHRTPGDNQFPARPLTARLSHPKPRLNPPAVNTTALLSFSFVTHIILFFFLHFLGWWLWLPYKAESRCHKLGSTMFTKSPLHQQGRHTAPRLNKLRKVLRKLVES